MLENWNEHQKISVKNHGQWSVQRSTRTMAFEHWDYAIGKGLRCPSIYFFMLNSILATHENLGKGQTHLSDLGFLGPYILYLNNCWGPAHILQCLDWGLAHTALVRWLGYLSVANLPLQGSILFFVWGAHVQKRTHGEEPSMIHPLINMTCLCSSTTFLVEQCRRPVLSISPSECRGPNGFDSN